MPLIGRGRRSRYPSMARSILKESLPTLVTVAATDFGAESQVLLSRDSRPESNDDRTAGGLAVIREQRRAPCAEGAFNGDVLVGARDPTKLVQI